MTEQMMSLLHRKSWCGTNEPFACLLEMHFYAYFVASSYGASLKLPRLDMLMICLYAASSFCLYLDIETLWCYLDANVVTLLLDMWLIWQLRFEQNFVNNGLLNDKSFEICASFPQTMHLLHVIMPCIIAFVRSPSDVFYGRKLVASMALSASSLCLKSLPLSTLSLMLKTFLFFHRRWRPLLSTKLSKSSCSYFKLSMLILYNKSQRRPLAFHCICYC